MDITLRYLAGNDDQSENTRAPVNSTFVGIGVRAESDPGLHSSRTALIETRSQNHGNPRRSVILIHVLAIVLAAFSFDLLGRILLGLHLAFIAILVCATMFIIIWGLHRSYDWSRRTRWQLCQEYGNTEVR